MSHPFRSNGIIEEGQVKNSAITNSSIDMNNGVIIDHGTPIQPTDVVNKSYIDIKISAFTINITGENNPTTIILPPSTNILEGDLTISIKNIVENGPSAKFSICKSYPGINGVIYRSISSPAFGTLETLVMEWDVSSNPVIYKTGENYNGLYQIVVVINI
jgi:hypothetical protein